MNKSPKILVIVPAYNEAENLPHVLEELADCGTELDVVVVNDGSTDDTSAAARRNGAVVIDLPMNSGMFCALQTGFRYAFRHSYDIAIQVDADGQHDPSGIPALVRPILDNDIDVVIGSRFLGRTDYRMPLQRSIGIRVFGWITSLVVGQRITDTTCGFRAHGQAAIKLFATETSFEFRDAVGVVVLHRGGFTITEVPTVVRPRRSGESSISVYGTLVYPFHYLLALIVVLLREPTRKG